MDLNILSMLGNNQKYFKNGKVIKSARADSNSSEKKFSDILETSMKNESLTS